MPRSLERSWRSASSGYGCWPRCGSQRTRTTREPDLIRTRRELQRARRSPGFRQIRAICRQRRQRDSSPRARAPTDQAALRRERRLGAEGNRAMQHAVVCKRCLRRESAWCAIFSASQNPLESVTLEVDFPTRPGGRAHGIVCDGHASHGPSNSTHEQTTRQPWRREPLASSIIRLRAAAESRQANPSRADPRPWLRLLLAADQETVPVRFRAAPIAGRLRMDPSCSGREELRRAGSSRDTPRRQTRMALEGTMSAPTIGSCWRCAASGWAARRRDSSRNSDHQVSKGRARSFKRSVALSGRPRLRIQG